MSEERATPRSYLGRTADAANGPDEAVGACSRAPGPASCREFFHCRAELACAALARGEASRARAGIASIPAGIMWATVYLPPANTSCVTHLNVLSASPLVSIGAYVGNDQVMAEFSSVRLTVYDVSNHPVGTLVVPVNNDLSVDQFVGLTSTVPFVRARSENLRPDGSPSLGYSVVIDDLSFTTEGATPVLGPTWGSLKSLYR